MCLCNQTVYSHGHHTRTNCMYSAVENIYATEVYSHFLDITTTNYVFCWVFMANHTKQLWHMGFQILQMRVWEVWFAFVFKVHPLKSQLFGDFTLSINMADGLWGFVREHCNSAGAQMRDYVDRMTISWAFFVAQKKPWGVVFKVCHNPCRVNWKQVEGGAVVRWVQIAAFWLTYKMLYVDKTKTAHHAVHNIPIVKHGGASILYVKEIGKSSWKDGLTVLEEKLLSEWYT